jgi:aminoglycoside/choline kinase family phosphotransferase
MPRDNNVLPFVFKAGGGTVAIRFDGSSMTDARQAQLGEWLAHTFAAGDITLTMVSGDASFRRYFRTRLDGKTLIAVDAPPELEDNPRFVSIARLFQDAGVRTPEVVAADFQQGFMLLDDLGDELYLDSLLAAQQDHNLALADELYRKAIDTLISLQQGVDKGKLDPYDRDQLHNEMALFDQWFCSQLLGLNLNASEQQLIEATYQLLEDEALRQPAVAVHRDYHSRNLMIINPGPGVIDFQDAVAGPYTYDLVSLLRDCYIRWPDEQVLAWARYYQQQAEELGIIPAQDFASLQRDMDLMGLQRHLKVMGIFSRLSLRDKKPRYLADIPLVIDYFRDVAAVHPELSDFVDWFQQRVLPAAERELDLNTRI